MDIPVSDVHVLKLALHITIMSKRTGPFEVIATGEDSSNSNLFNILAICLSIYIQLAMLNGVTCIEQTCEHPLMSMYAVGTKP
jgi:hypothetical protein